MSLAYGLNECGFPTDDFEDTCAIVADAGYDGVELNVTRDGALRTDAGRKDAKRTVDAHDLTVPSISTTAHWEFPLSSADDERREIGLGIARDMIDAAAALDARHVLLVPAVVDADTSYEDAYRRAVDSVRDLARYADDRDVTVTIENVQNNFLPSPAAFVDFLDEVNDPHRVEAYFDIGNAFRAGLPTQWMQALDDRIAKIHVKDWLTDAHRPTYPPQGDIEWPATVDAFRDLEYDGWIIAEMPPYPSYPERMPPQVLDELTFLFDPARADGGETR